MEPNRRIELITTWSENEKKINELVKELEEANRLKSKIEEEIPALRETGKWEMKYFPPKKPQEAKKTTTYKGEEVTKSKKRKMKTEEALKKKIAKINTAPRDDLELLPKGGIDKSQNFNRPEKY